MIGKGKRCYHIMDQQVQKINAPLYDIVAVGESLIDLIVTPRDESIEMLGHAGGSVGNVLAAAARFGRRTALISKVGNDVFGRFFRVQMNKAGIDTRALLIDERDALTTLAVVTLDDRGEREFSFFRNETADITLNASEIDYTPAEHCRIFHFSSVSLTQEPARAANFITAERAKAAGAKLAFDPNYRAFLWASVAEARAQIDAAMSMSNYIKVSEDEVTMMTGELDPARAGRCLYETYAPDLVVVTLGSKGSIAITGNATVQRPAPFVQVVDTTGAGDGYWGAMLHQLLNVEDSGGKEALLRALTDAEILGEIIVSANAVGAFCTTRKGAISAMMNIPVTTSYLSVD
jgi:fructokinase